jgi:tRNA pseudouridine38-40 synthase
MQNIKLTLAYDGTDFHGWQIQPGEPTIQGTIAAVLREITQDVELTLHGAGRTDAGVHASGQVANFRTGSALTPADFTRALNALLPPSIRILAAEQVAPEFHARWLAAAKTYRYRIDRGTVVPPFSWRYVLHHPHPLDFDAMALAARAFEGEHDFTSFAASTGSEEDDRERTPIRTIFRSEMLSGPGKGVLEESAPGKGALETTPEWIYEVRGRSFLRHMVRKILGTLLEVGRGRLTPGDVPRILAQRDRTCSGPTAAAHGLCLTSVEYPDLDNSSG